MQTIRNMKVAVCLYGQPRDYKTGHKNIMDFIRNNNQHTFEFFLHCWGADNAKLGHSPWRIIPETDLYINNMETIRKDLLSYYNPRSFLFEKPIEKFDITNIEKSTMFLNGNQSIKRNIHNTLSQAYSRNKVRDLLEEYTHKNNISYDMVITTRIDYAKPLPFLMRNIDMEKVYVSDMHRPRYIFPDNFILAPFKVYLTWFDLYKKLPNVINNKQLENIMKTLQLNFVLNIEEYIIANFLMHFDIKNVVYEPTIANAI